MSNKKIPLRAYIDIEATRHALLGGGIVELGIIITKKGSVVDSLYLKCKAHPSCAIQYNSVKNKRHTLESFEAFAQYKAFLNKWCSPRKTEKSSFDLLWGRSWNAPFDEPLLRKWHTDHGCNFFRAYYNFNWKCAMRMCTDLLQKRGINPSHCSLQSMAEYFNIPIEKRNLHTALYDADLSRKVINKVLEWNKL